ncbi:MAG: hypothetical protein Q7J06_00025 [Bacteroidales bacterium]|nr:hypothetical protein [Bacteroidales bacterium]
MKISKAIEILSHFGRYGSNVKFNDVKEATQLGIEALKEIQHLHESQVLDEDELLPGETPEEEV